MARLDRDPGAGGRRRARAAEQDAGQRAQRGKRPEESRAERQADGETSRRNTEAMGRERNSERRASRTSNQSHPQAANSAPAIDRESGNFQDHLAMQESQGGVAAGNPTLATESIDDTSANSGILPAHQAPLLNTQARVNDPTHKNTVSLSIPSGPGVNRGGAPPSSAVLAPIGQAQTVEPQTKKASAAAAPSAPPELSDAQEAQRSSQVMRQLRMQLHPGLRSATVHLHPAELGRLQVKLRTEGGEVSAVVRAESEDALAILQRHVPELEAAFADQGYDELTFEFLLDQEGSQDPSAWNFDRDVSAELEARLEQKQDTALRRNQSISDLGVDTYA